MALPLYNDTSFHFHNIVRWNGVLSFGFDKIILIFGYFLVLGRSPTNGVWSVSLLPRGQSEKPPYFNFLWCPSWNTPRRKSEKPAPSQASHCFGSQIRRSPGNVDSLRGDHRATPPISGQWTFRTESLARWHGKVYTMGIHGC